MPAIDHACRELRPEHEPAVVQRERFLRMHHEGGRLIRDWFERGAQAFRADPKDPFESFIYVWFAVNGWAACVTEQDRDASLVIALQFDPTLTESFVQLLDADKTFQQAAESLRALLPIFKVQEIRKARLPIRRDGDRAAIVQHYLRHGMRQFAPMCAGRHIEFGEPIPLDWQHVMPAIYRVRCNLFHGDKGAHSEMDRRVVSAACAILVGVFGREMDW